MNIVPHTVRTYIVLLRYGSTVRTKFLLVIVIYLYVFLGGGIIKSY